MSDVSNYLYNEIRESQKFRFELLKWKLFVVAAISSVGFGMTDKLNASYFVLCLIPFACLYIDMIHRHLVLRGKVNGEYLSQIGESLSFEKVFRELSKNVFGSFALESFVVVFSSVLFSISVAIIGFYVPNGIPLIICGSIGVLSAFAIEFFYQSKRKKIEKEMKLIIKKMQD